MAYGRRLLPQVVDRLAETDPVRVYASIPKSATSLSDGYQNVTMLKLASMVNSIAKWIETTIGAGGHDTVAYIGPTDIRYTIMFLGAVKAGYKVLFVCAKTGSHQNSGMLVETDCKALFHAQEMSTVTKPLQADIPNLKVVEVASLDDLLTTPASTEHYPYEETFEDAEHNPCLILHSSGSSGEPKLVTMTHGTLSVIDNDRFMPIPEGRAAQNAAQFDFEGGGKFYSCFPAHHLSGVHAYITIPIFSSSATVVFSPSNLPPSGYLLSEVLRAQSLHTIYVPPGILEQWSAEPASDEQAKQLPFILFGGGSISPQTGHRLSKLTSLRQTYEALEFGHIQLLVPEDHDTVQEDEWSYMELNPYVDCEMVPVEGDIYEMVLHQDEEFSVHHALWHNLPDVDVLETGDLFTPHPSKEGLWRFHSRKEDTIVLSGNQEFHPAEMENIIQGNPLLSGALIVGQGRSDPMLILEVHPDFCDKYALSSLVNKVWPQVEQANAVAPVFARIAKSNVILAHPDQPFPRTSTGTIIRKLATRLYNHEIETAYNGGTISPGRDSTVFNEDTIDGFLLDAVTHWVSRHVHKALPNMEFSDTDNIFVLGLDSLQAAGLSRSLQKGCSSLQPSSTTVGATTISLRMIYQYPTIEELSAVVYQVLFQGATLEQTPAHNIRGIENAFTELVTDLPKCTNRAVAVTKSPDAIKVVLIGPRGSVGPNVLRELLADPRVKKVYCLNRGTDGRERMQKVFRSRYWGWDAKTLADRVSFFPINFGQPRLGLEEEHYTELLENANVIIHNAWKVDFSWTLESYKAQHLRSVRELVDLSSQSALTPRIVFISSITAVQDWASVYDGPVTEEPLPVPEVASQMGYGQSNHVAELVLNEAASISNVPVTILRVGQVAGPTMLSGGTWSTDEWIPSVAAISKTLQLIPNDLPAIDWVPVDVISRAICELALHQTVKDSKLSGSAKYDLDIFNVVNPNLVSWSCFAQALQQRLGDKAKRVTLGEWVKCLVERDPNTMSETEAINSTKILPFFQHMAETTARGAELQPKFETGKAAQASTTMATMEAIDPSLIKLWLKQWGI